jgi:hypothetical protein
MQRVTRHQALTYLQQHGAPRAVIQALGNYSEGDSNTFNQPTYNEASVFHAPGGSDGGVQIITPPVTRNVNSFATYPFVIGAAPITILPNNPRRSLLLVQNQSASDDLYVNFSADAGVNVGIMLVAGAGVFFDYVCPNNSVSVYFDSGSNQPGIIIEGAPQL